jgi:ATP-dependent RNA helicase DeaD
MLDLGFREELEAILDAAPAERRTLLFSATLPKPIVALARTYQSDALRITVAGAEQGHADIEYRAVRIAPSDTEHAVVNILRYFDPAAALVFCSTREAVRRLHANLVERGFSVVALSGELSQAERTHALQALRDHRARVCVATDVAARGIDIPDLELVIHAELPHDAESLQHRSGRTGRAGKKGISVILATHPKRKRAEMLLRNAKIEADWMPPPSAEHIRAKDQERLIEQLRPTEDASEDDIAIARALLKGGDAEQVVAALVRARRAALPAAEDLVDHEPEPAPRSAPRPGFENTSWFSIDIGRSKNADPRWLLPLICRRGHVTKKEIGAIRVFDRETRFEIVQDAAGRFIAALGKGEEDGVHIQSIADPEAYAPRDRKPFKKKVHADQGGGKTLYEKKTYEKKAVYDRQSRDVAPREPAPTRNVNRDRPPPTHSPNAGRFVSSPSVTSKKQNAKLKGGKPRGGKPPR